MSAKGQTQDDVVNLARITAAESRGSEWRQDAACRGADPEVFYPVRGENAVEAKALCAGCPVVEQCLEYALAANIYHGVWGGLSIREREQVKRRRGAA